MHRPRRSRGTAAAVVLAVVLAACSRGGSDAAPTTSTTTTTAPAPPPTTEVASPTVELLSPGAAPRQLLRYRLTAGATSEITVTTTMTIRQTDEADHVVEVVVPTVVARLRLDVVSVANDEATINLSYLGALVAAGSGLSAAETDATNAALAAVAGITGSGRITSDGRLRAFAWGGLGGLDEKTRQVVTGFADALPALVTPLPGASVGVGASWRSTTSAEVDDSTTEVVTTYSLTGVVETGLGYRAGSRTTSGDRTTTADGRTLTISDIATTSTTTGNVDLATLLSRAQIDTAATQVVTVARAGSTPARLRQEITSTVTVAPSA